MHSYLKSIGFSEIGGKKEVDKILKDVVNNYDEKVVVEDRPNHLFAELSKIYGCDFGITVCGEYDENNEFQMEYYFPYFRGTGIATQEEVMIEKHAGKESFAGAIDDVRVGVTIIFYLQNAGAYLTERSHGTYAGGAYPVTLAALAKEGKILLPVKKDEKWGIYNKNGKLILPIEYDSIGCVVGTASTKSAGDVVTIDDYEDIKEKENSVNRSRMIAAARNGDEEAMENLTMEDIDTYSMISGRISNEDLYSIVDTYFMPYGMECDLYNVMGEITDFSRVRNIATDERIYELRISCNDLDLDICINKNDLIGEPEVGRRFKGVIWLQGNVHF